MMKFNMKHLISFSVGILLGLAVMDVPYLQRTNELETAVGMTKLIYEMDYADLSFALSKHHDHPKLFEKDFQNYLSWRFSYNYIKHFPESGNFMAAWYELLNQDDVSDVSTSRDVLIKIINNSGLPYDMQQLIKKDNAGNNNSKLKFQNI